MYEVLLLAIDGSDPSKRALDAAKELACVAKGEIKVLHVRERGIAPGGLGAQLETEDPSDAENLVARAVATLKSAGVKASAEVVDTTSVAKGILQAADATGASVIVMGTRGHSDLASLLVGSTAHKVIHLASCPVLVVA